MTSSVAQFGLKSKSFLYLSSDNRLHFWDIDNRKEKRVYVEKNHLSHKYTSSDWLLGKKDNLGQYAIGTSDGTIILWDLARGVVSKTLGVAGTSPAPTDIKFSNDGNSLFVSSSQPHVVQYNLANGEVINTFKASKKGSLVLAVNPKVDVLAIAR